MNKYSGMIIKHFAILALILIIYVGFAFIGGGLLKEDFLYNGLLVATICMYMGYLSGNFLLANIKFNIANQWSFLRYIAANLGVLIVCGALYFVYRNHFIVRIVYEIILGGTYYYIGLKFYNKEYYEILNTMVIFVGGVIVVGSIFLVNFFDSLMYLKTYFLGVFYFAFLIYLIVLNHRRIDTEIYQKGSFKGIPFRIKLFNLRLTIYVYIIFAVIINIKQVYSYLVSIVVKIITFILYIIEKLFSLFSFDAASNFQEKISTTNEVYENGIIGNIINIIVILFVGFCFFKMIPVIKKILYDSICMLINLIKKLFGIEVKTKKQDVDIEYIDDITYIDKNYEKKNKKLKIKKLWFMNLDKINDPKARIRAIYKKLLIKIITKYEIDILKSDTPADIAVKINGVVMKKEIIDFITKMYQKIRYGDKSIKSSELNEYESKYNELKRYIR